MAHMYKPILYAGGYWLMKSEERAYYWMILSPEGEMMHARTSHDKGIKTHPIQVHYPFPEAQWEGKGWVETELYNIREVFKRVITPEEENG